MTCPLTENGFLRIFGHPGYPGGPGSPEGARKELRVIRGMACHRFIPDSVSIDELDVFRSLAGVGPEQITDLYLLGLAVRNRITFASSDRGVQADHVKGGAAALAIIP